MRQAILGVAAVSCLLLAVSDATAGEIRGRIIINKVLTKKRLALPDYQLRGAAPAPAKPEPATDEYSRTIVYLDGPASETPPSTGVKLVQKGTRFSPEILVVPVGSTVSFPNQDPVFHNVFSLSKAKEFDLGYYPSGETRTVRFDKVGVVQVYCHIHRDMSAAILVVPNSTHIHPAKDGSFTITDAPAGPQFVVVWHKSAGFFRKKVEVPSQGPVDVEFSIPVPSME